MIMLNHELTTSPRSYSTIVLSLLTASLQARHNTRKLKDILKLILMPLIVIWNDVHACHCWQNYSARDYNTTIR